MNSPYFEADLLTALSSKDNQDRVAPLPAIRRWQRPDLLLLAKGRAPARGQRAPSPGRSCRRHRPFAAKS
ncbi:hypothetical protein QEH56_23050 [Pelagicoccus enzymogenes]|uniref:hypothetical protein n=1 Tax=Pelagicoccus enzymogenes TaxID=2773457 RepID=UPI00280D052E|nr:hypothetical protein [Pelagicoccus enzymogenes]MDQ8201063.1 hypothetical protein [Pelagicoccus enzymogenes]